MDKSLKKNPVFIEAKTAHFVGRLKKGCDLKEEIVRVCNENKIRSGWFSVIGAFNYAELMEYDQVKRVYKEAKIFKRELEILNLTGNISSLSCDIFVHAHAILSYEDGREINLIGGHLGKSSIFAAEIFLTAFCDLELTRHEDVETGLKLW